MVKTRISKGRRIYTKRSQPIKLDKIPGVSRERPLEYLTDEKNVSLAVMECLQNNDPEGVMEVIGTYIEALNKSELRKKSHLSKSTMYNFLRHKNPTVKTLAKIMHSCVS